MSCWNDGCQGGALLRHQPAKGRRSVCRRQQDLRCKESGERARSRQRGVKEAEDKGAWRAMVANVALTAPSRVVVECAVQRGWKVPNKTPNKIGLINGTWNNGH